MRSQFLCVCLISLTLVGCGGGDSSSEVTACGDYTVTLGQEQTEEVAAVAEEESVMLEEEWSGEGRADVVVLGCDNNVVVSETDVQSQAKVLSDIRSGRAHAIKLLDPSSAS